VWRLPIHTVITSYDFSLDFSYGNHEGSGTARAKMTGASNPMELLAKNCSDDT